MNKLYRYRCHGCGAYTLFTGVMLEKLHCAVKGRCRVCKKEYEIGPDAQVHAMLANIAEKARQWTQSSGS